MIHETRRVESLLDDNGSLLHGPWVVTQRSIQDHSIYE
jgi:hypothetical protein